MAEDIADIFTRVRGFQARTHGAQPPDLGGYQGRFQSLRDEYWEKVRAKEEARAAQRTGQYAVPGLDAYGYTPGQAIAKNDLQKYVAKVAAKRYGWKGPEWDALFDLIRRESGWNHLAKNPKSTAWGLFQFLKQTAKNYGIPWGTDDYRVQTDAGLRYIKDRYGSPSAALRHWLSRVPINGRDVGHWY